MTLLPIKFGRPLLANLRGEPRFKKLMERVKYEIHQDVNATSLPAGYRVDAREYSSRSKEVAMKSKLIIACVALGLLLSSTPLLRCSETDAESIVTHATSVILDRSSSGSAIKAALLEILDASLMILPETDYAGEYKSRIEVAKKEFDRQSLFSDKGHQYLSLAYRLVTAGKKWQFPEEIGGAYKEKDIMEQAKSVGQKLIDSALGELKAGRSEQSVRYLLEFVLMVVTPMKRQVGG